MNRLLLTILISTLSLVGYGQIQLNLTKIDSDSVEISFSGEPDLEMNKTYDFIIKTNINKSDSLYLNLIDGLIEDNIEFKKSFNYHLYDISVTRKPKPDHAVHVANRLIQIKGTRFRVKIDGVEISRYNPNNIKGDSKVEIELISDIYDLNELTVKDPVIFTWMQNKSVFEKVELNSNKLSVNLKELKVHKTGFTKDAKYNHVMIVLPQVHHNGIPVLAESQQERMQILKFEK